MREFSERLKASGRDKAESKSAPNKDAPASSDGEKWGLERFGQRTVPRIGRTGCHCAC
jgi:hypothetical protein